MKTPINEEAIKLWVEKLRSGEYEQGEGALRVKGEEGDQYCCLGLACDVYRELTGKGEWKDPVVSGEDTEGVKYRFEIDGIEASERRKVHYLTPEVASFFGFPHDSENPILDFENREEQAAVANDKALASFDQIAAAVERTFLTVGQDD